MKRLYRQRVARTLAVVFGGYLVFYLGWRATATLNPDALWFSLALLAVEASALINFGLFAFMTWDVHHRARFQFRPGAQADIFIPTYNEDVSILEATLVGCGAVTYPHTTYVLDDGRRPEVEKLAKRLGCKYLTRPDNAHAKAGNLNAAVRQRRPVQGDQALPREPVEVRPELLGGGVGRRVRRDRHFRRDVAADGEIGR